MKLGTTQINKVYLGATEAKKIYLGTTLVLDNGTNDTVVTIDTTSTSATWTPTNIINSGATLTWEVTGDVTPIAPQVIDKPILNLSSNTGTANITITSSTGFVGFSELWLNNGTTSLEVTSIDISEATALTKIDLFNNNLTTIDISANTALVNPWVQSNTLTAFDPSTNVLAEFIAVDTNSLTALDISANVLLTDLWAYDNLLTTAELDAIINDLDTNGLSNGVVKLAGNTGLPLTAASGTAYDALVGKGWTIDVAKYTPVDTEDPVIGTLAYANETDTTVELSMSVASTDNIAVVEHWIYKDFVFEEIVVGATFTDHEITGLTANTNYDFVCVAYDAAGNFSLTSNTVNFTTDATPTPPATDGLRPVLSNFHIKAGVLDKLYFDSSKIITASTGVNGYTGFTITDKVISQITINTGLLVDHYFDVTVGFDHYSNNTIRYSTGSDLADADSGALYPFDLQYITNNIVEPSTNSTKFVAVGASGGGDSIGDPMVWSDAQSVAAGTKVNWAKGDYGAINFVQSTSGTLALPIVHEGYDTTPGDSPSLTWDVDLAFDGNVMPWIHNPIATSLDQSKSFSLGGNDYIIVKNILVEGADESISFGGQSEYCILDNVYAKNSYTYTIKGFYTSMIGCRVINSFIGKSAAHGIRMAGNRHLMDNCYVSSTDGIHQDYFVSIYAAASGNGESIIRNLTIIRDITSLHWGHGISLRQGGVGRAIQNTLVEDCYIEAVGSAALELRSPDVEYNVLRNIEVDNKNLTSGTFNAMRITSAQNNIIDGLIAYDCEIFVRFLGGSEEQSQIDAVDAGNNNLFKNCVMYNKSTSNSNWSIVREEEDGTAQDRVPNDNTFVNCTFDNITYAISMYNASRGQGNEFINCIFNNIDLESQSFSNDWVYSYSDFYTSFPTPSGTGNISVKPDFADLANNDYSLSSITSSLIYEGGTDAGVYYDITGREKITPFSMGAYEKQADDIFPTRYVSLSGDNSDGLTEATAWNNLISVENDSINWLPGEVVAFNSGDEFIGNLTLTSVDGVSTNPITLTSYGTGKTIITGGEEITGWTNTSGNIWEADVTGKTIYQVIKNNQALRLASYPKIVTDYSTTNNVYQITSATSESQFISNDLIGLADFAGGFVGCFIHNSSVRSQTVQSFNSGTGEVILDAAIGGLGANDYFFVSNAFNLLDDVDEWYYDITANKLYVYSLSSPSDIYATTINGNGIKITNSDYLDVTNLQVKYYTGNGIDYDLSNNNLIDSNDIYYCQNDGIITDHGTLNTISNNYIKGSLNIGINDRTTFSPISNNEIYEIGMLKDITDVQKGGARQGIEIASEGALMSNNELKKIGYIGVFIKDKDVTVQENFIQDYCLVLHDGGAIYTWNTTYTDTRGENLLVDKNIILQDNITLSDQWYDYPIYCDNFAHDVTITDNSTSGGITSLFLHDSKDISCDGNNLYMSQRRSVLISEDGDGDGDGSVINNDFSNNNAIFNYNFGATFNPKSSFVAPFNFGVSDYNQWYNLSATAERIVRFEVDGTIEQLTLAQWQSLYSQDLNSGSSADVGTITDTDFLYNATSTAVDKTLQAGTWQELDGTTHSGTVTLQPYTSIILIQL